MPSTIAAIKASDRTAAANWSRILSSTSASFGWLHDAGTTGTSRGIRAGSSAGSSEKSGAVPKKCQPAGGTGSKLARFSMLQCNLKILSAAASIRVNCNLEMGPENLELIVVLLGISQADLFPRD
jgi:hypothetical protein